MIEIRVEGLVKSFEAGETILDGLSFQVERGEHIGILGRNGAGKSTLFRILTGAMDHDSGEIRIAPGRRIGLVSQIPDAPPGWTVEDALRSAFGRLRALAEEMEVLEGRMEAGESEAALLRRYDALSERFQRFGGYETDVAVDKVANGLGIPAAQRSQLFESLSGGERARTDLARLILEDADILLLDEPTNHLDLRSTEWLERYLDGFQGTVLTISHDRWFLDRTVSRIVEIEDGKASLYSGAYTFYAEEKERRYQEQLKRYEKEKAEIDRLTETARRMHEHDTEHLNKRAASIEKRIERLRSTARPVRRREIRARFTEAEFRGDEMLTIRGLSKSYGERRLFSGVDLKILGGERIALIGPNGAGKSTFLKILMGEEHQDEGRIRIAPQTRIAYLPQIIHFEDPGADLVSTMASVRRGMTVQAARDALARFGFRGKDVYKPVGALSGGEQSRLRLCMLMDGEVDLLILDEPTNHLDIASREWIEEAVSEYGGALLLVSHDRWTIDRFAQRIWELEGGILTDWPMGFGPYLAEKERQEVRRQEQAEADRAARAEEKKAERRRRGDRKQQSAKRQLTICEREIARAEERIRELDARMEAAATDYQALTELSSERETVQAELDGLYERWEQLGEEAGT